MGLLSITVLWARKCLERYVFAQQALLGTNAELQLSEQLTEDSLYMLILHEIGHTLGLTHNMRASQLLPDVFDAEAVEAQGLSASVMDYEAVNVAPEAQDSSMVLSKAARPPMTFGHCNTATGIFRRTAGGVARAFYGG